jgi:hypothetical protein
MHDWAQIVRERLATLALDDDDAAQVFDELTGHLEQDYRSLLSEGCSEEEAVRRALVLATGKFCSGKSNHLEKRSRPCPTV